MKLRESGMPEEESWERLFNVELIVDRMGIDGKMRDVAELGCGYGAFTLAVAPRAAAPVPPTSASTVPPLEGAIAEFWGTLGACP
jgi:hypothetical protein